jgi:hypothetical protein
MKTLSSLVFIFVSATLYSQGVIYEKKFPLNHINQRFEADSYAVKNQGTEETSLFVVDKDIIHGILFDKEMKQTNQLSTKRPEGNYRFLIGGVVSDNIYYLFFSDKDRMSFISVAFDYNTRNVKVRNGFISNEKHVAVVVTDNQLFVFTTVKGETDLKVHVYDGELRHKQQAYNFDKKMFASVQNLNTFRKVIDQDHVVVDVESPVSIDLAVVQNKIFTYGNKILWTIDRLDYATVVLEFDVKTLDARVSYYNYKFVNCGPGERKDANSYFFDGKLYQLNLCSSGMTFTIRDVTTGDIIREHSIYGDDEITFANTPFIVSTSETGTNDRELSKTKQFLRKSALSFVGVGVHPDGDDVVVTIGALMQSEGTATTVVRQPIATFGGGGMVFGTVYLAFDIYSNSKSIFFKSKMRRSTLEHIPGEIQTNAFDKIKEFKSMQSDIAMEAETIFKAANAYILGYYNANNESYIMRAF